MTDSELLERIRLGSGARDWAESQAARSALEELLGRQYDWVTRLCLVEFRREDVAYDCVQEIMIAVSKSLSSFEGRSKFSTWMYTIVRRQIGAYRRREWLRKLRLPGTDTEGAEDRVPDAPELTPERLVGRAKLKDMLLEGVRKLPEKQRHAITLYYFENLPVADGAERLGCSEASFKTHLFRGRDRLKGLLPDGLLEEFQDD